MSNTDGLVLIKPVVGAGLVTPRPSMKIVTRDPAAAGWVEELKVPSALSVRGKVWLKMDGWERKATGLRAATVRSFSESDTVIPVDVGVG